MEFKKHVFRKFHYNEADDFANYLTAMAGKGWRFQGFSVGMAFERCEPQEISYDVEVFLKNSELDSLPQTDTEEFAEYCQAAGYKMIDGTRRFVVFEKERPDVLPIFTPEERLREIFRAERHQRFLNWISFVLILCDYGISAYLFPEFWLFHTVMNLIVLCFLSMAFLQSLLLAGVFLWHWRKRHILEKEGGFRANASFLEKIVSLLKDLTPFLVLAGVLNYYIKTDESIAFWFLVSFACALIPFLLLGMMRFSKMENIFYAIGTTIFVMFVLIVMMLAMPGQNQKQMADASGLLSLADLGLESDALMDYEQEEEQSLIGKMESLSLYYRIEEEDTDAYTQVHQYQSRFPWVLSLLKKREMKQEPSILENLSEDGSEDEIIRYETYGNIYRHYIVSSDGELVIFRTTQELKPEQFQKIREKLGV